MHRFLKPVLTSTLSLLVATGAAAAPPHRGQDAGGQPLRAQSQPAPQMPSRAPPVYHQSVPQAPPQRAPERRDVPRTDVPRPPPSRDHYVPRADGGVPHPRPVDRDAIGRDGVGRSDVDRDGVRRNRDGFDRPRGDDRNYHPPSDRRHPPQFVPARPRHDRPSFHPPHVRPYWNWRNHCGLGCGPYFSTFGWWGSWCWDAPQVYRNFATPLSVVDNFSIPPPPGYDTADVSYFKNGVDRTIRVELTRERRNGLELTVLRDDNAGCEELSYAPCRGEFSRLDQAVVIPAVDREQAIRSYWENDQGNFRKTPGLFEAIYDGVIYPDVRDRLIAQRLW